MSFYDSQLWKLSLAERADDSFGPERKILREAYLDLREATSLLVETVAMKALPCPVTGVHCIFVPAASQVFIACLCASLSSLNTRK